MIHTSGSVNSYNDDDLVKQTQLPTFNGRHGNLSFFLSFPVSFFVCLFVCFTLLSFGQESGPFGGSQPM